jgi:hypothetical protein
MRRKLRTNNLVRTRARTGERPRGELRAGGAVQGQRNNEPGVKTRPGETTPAHKVFGGEVQPREPDGPATKRRSGGAAQLQAGNKAKDKKSVGVMTPAHKVPGGDDLPQEPAGEAPQKKFVFKPIVWEIDLSSPTANRFQLNPAHTPAFSIPHFYRDLGNISAWLEGGPGPVDYSPEPETEM